VEGNDDTQIRQGTLPGGYPNDVQGRRGTMVVMALVMCHAD
jgi:hypothetical protein